MQVEFKGQKSFIYKPFATLWASCNQLPVSHDRTDAWYERLILLGFFEQHTGKQRRSHAVATLDTTQEPIRYP